MLALAERRSLTPVALTRLLEELQGHAAITRTLYLTSGALGNPLAPVPAEERPALEDLDEAAHHVQDSETGAVFLWGREHCRIVVPPFPVQKDALHLGLAPSALLDIVQHRYWIGVVLLRLGSYSVGVFQGSTLVASKTDTRYVKGRHRAGGSSAKRFQRIREKQVQELFKKACSVAQDVMAPYGDGLEYLLFGGERHVLAAFRQECPYLARFAGRTLERVLPVHEPRRAELERMPQEVYASRVLTFARMDGPLGEGG